MRKTIFLVYRQFFLQGTVKEFFDKKKFFANVKKDKTYKYIRICSTYREMCEQHAKVDDF